MPIEIDLNSYSGLAVGFLVGLLSMKYYVRYTYGDLDEDFSSDDDSNWEPDDDITSDDEQTQLLKESSEIKMVIAVRTDLKMGKGKICAQVGHGVLSAGMKCRRKFPKIYNKYQWCGQKKICVKASSQEQLETLQACAKSLNLIAETICDAGHTQIAAGSMTVCAIGPGPANLIDQVTGDLKLL